MACHDVSRGPFVRWIVVGLGLSLGGAPAKALRPRSFLLCWPPVVTGGERRLAQSTVGGDEHNAQHRGPRR